MTRSATRVVIRAAIGLLVPGALVLGMPGPASAHVALLTSTPGDGARLEEFPSQVVLEFSQAIAPPAYAIVTGPGGTDLRVGDLAVDGPRLVVPTRPAREAGSYTIAYRVVSDDGHPISGQLTATIGVGTGTPATQSADGADDPEESDPAPRDTGVAIAAPTVALAEPTSNRTVVASSVGIALFTLAGLLALLARRTGPAATPHHVEPEPNARRN